MVNRNEDLQIIPGVGPSIAQDFLDINIKTVADLKGKDPEELYDRICRKQGCRVDRCVLYVCRCAVYFAQGGRDAQKLKWWDWKDKGPIV